MRKFRRRKDTQRSSKIIKSHFQNSQTYSRLLDRLFAHIEDKRVRLGMRDCKAAILHDHAPAHEGAGPRAAAARHNTEVCEVPLKMTHAFNPPDQYVIKGLRNSVEVAWEDWLQNAFSHLPVDDAVKAFCQTSLAPLRLRMYRFLSTAIDALGSAAVVASWEVCGLLRAMYTEVPARAVILDTMREAAGLDLAAGAAAVPAQMGAEGAVAAEVEERVHAEEGAGEAAGAEGLAEEYGVFPEPIEDPTAADAADMLADDEAEETTDAEEDAADAVDAEGVSDDYAKEAEEFECLLERELGEAALCDPKLDPAPADAADGTDGVCTSCTFLLQPWVWSECSFCFLPFCGACFPLHACRQHKGRGKGKGASK